MQKYNKHALAAVIVLCTLAGGNLFADVTTKVKQAESIVRDAEKMMHNGKSAEADQALAEAMRLIEQVKSEEPKDKAILRVERKYKSVRAGVDKKLSQSAVQPDQAANSASTDKRHAAKLPGGVGKRLQDINKVLDEVEYQGNGYKLSSIEEKFAEIERMYGDKFDRAHADYAAARARYEKLQSAKTERAEAAQQHASQAQAAANDASAQAIAWTVKFQAYLAYPGNEGHNPEKLVYVPGTSEPEKFADAEHRLEEFKRFYAEFKNSAFDYGSDWKLKDLVDNQAPQRIESFETQFAQRQTAASGDVMQQIDSAMAQLLADNGWKTDTRIKPSLVDHKWMTSISEQVEKATTSLGKKNARSKEINQAYQELVAQDVKNRDVRKQRTFMEPDKYRGGDIDAIKEKAAALVKADSKEGGTPLRTTVISEEWREASAWEWTDTARTQRRYRTTRSLSAQVAAKRSDGVHLITVAIARDKQADGLWGPLYGNLHQYSEPMLEENVNKTGSSKIAVKAK